jgi:hypothetical protein
VGGIIGETFVPESLILPQNIHALCDNPGLRMAILATLPTLDESGVAVRQTGGWDPHHGIRISDAPARGPQPVGVDPSANPTVAPSTLDKGKGAASSASALGGSGGGRRRRGDAGCVALTGRSFRSPPEAPEDYRLGRGG